MSDAMEHLLRSYCAALAVFVPGAVCYVTARLYLAARPRDGDGE